MPRSILLRLLDIQDAITGITEVVAGAGQDAFAQNWGMARDLEYRHQHLPPLAFAIKNLIAEAERREEG